MTADHTIGPSADHSVPREGDTERGSGARQVGLGHMYLGEWWGLRVSEGPGGHRPVIAAGGDAGGVARGRGNAPHGTVVGALLGVDGRAAAGDPDKIAKSRVRGKKK